MTKTEIFPANQIKSSSRSEVFFQIQMPHKKYEINLMTFKWLPPWYFSHNKIFLLLPWCSWEFFGRKEHGGEKNLNLVYQVSKGFVFPSGWLWKPYINGSCSSTKNWDKLEEDINWFHSVEINFELIKLLLGLPEKLRESSRNLFSTEFMHYVNYFHKFRN